MKKKVFNLFVLLMLLTSAVSAQVKWGVKAGANINDVGISDYMHYKTTNYLGFSIGPTANIDVPINGVSVETAVLFDQQSIGLESEFLGGGRTYETVVRQQRIVVPVHLQYGIALNDKVTLNVFAGPQIGFRVGKKVTETDYADWLSKATTVNVNAGVGVLFSKHLQLSANYSFAVGKSGDFWINRKTKGGGSIIDDGKFRAVQLAAAYYF